MPYLLRIMEADLAYGHAAVFLEVRPRGVDHRDVVALVAYKAKRAGLARFTRNFSASRVL